MQEHAMLLQCLRSRLLGRWGIFVALGLGLGCQATSPVAAEQESHQHIPDQVDATPTHPFELLDALVLGDSLVIEVQYGGGCAEHDFSLLSRGPLMKSMPPKQMLQVVHYTTGDPCRALVVERQAFDLTPWRASPRGVTVIVLENWQTPLNYEYE
ncbi:MAG: hypothetical protein ACPGYK_00880 [Flavobacteriales bacterium]